VLDKVLLFHVEPSSNKIIKTTSGEVYLRIGDSSKKLAYDDIKNLEYDKGERLYEEELVERILPRLIFFLSRSRRRPWTSIAC
jgi:ATP-dependent DNA helicase RecG